MANTSCHISSATITWGDGTTATAGTDASTGQPGILGSHLYAEEGTYNASVTYTTAPGPFVCSPSGGTLTFTATVTDAR